MPTFLTNPEAHNQIGYDLAQHFCIFPIAKDKHQLTLAVVEPFSEASLDFLAQTLKTKIQTISYPQEVILSAIKKNYPSEDFEIAEPELTLASESSLDQELYQLITQALAYKASDIHLENTNKGICVRLRVNGQLESITLESKEKGNRMITRLKLLAHLDIDENRIPQESRIQFEQNGNLIDLRLSILPSLWGESLVIRILDQRQQALALSELGMREKEKSTLSKILKNTNGLFIVTGPTGSGKTTTLYAIIKHLLHFPKKIITIEEPVEYRLPGITQLSVGKKTNLRFSTALRSVLRQAPDILFVGEIRDKETALIVAEAALTGHMVLSTVHTANSFQALSRLIDLGIRRETLSSILLGILAQRLMRKLCPICAESYPISVSEESFFERIGIAPKKTLAKFRGCDQCHQGFIGRTGIFECLLFSSKLKSTLVQNFSEKKLKLVAKKEHFKSLLENGACAVLEKQTILSELLQTCL